MTWTFIEITSGFVLLDADEAWRLEQRGYNKAKTGYAVRGTADGGKQKGWLLHREIMGLDHGDPREVDHINGDRLDNRRCNLRVCTHAENQQNRQGGCGSSSHRGVSFYSPNGKWRAYCCPAGRFVSFGYFDTEEEAAQAAATGRANLMPFSKEALHA